MLFVDRTNLCMTRLVLASRYFVTAVLLFSLSPALLNAQQSVVEIRVVDTDFHGTPVPSIVVKRPPAEGQEQGPTDEAGLLVLEMDCPQGTKIQARPVSTAYTYSRWVFCKDKKKLTLKVTSIRVATALVGRLIAAIRSGDSGVGAHLATELSWVNWPIGQRIETGGTESGFGGGEGGGFGIGIGFGAGGRRPDIAAMTGVQAEYLAYKLAGEKLDVKDPAVFDPLQGKYVMTSHFRALVSRFQEMNRMVVSGKLDYKTLHAISGRTSGGLRRVPSPKSAPLK